MNDPHVEALRYRLVPIDGITFAAPRLDRRIAGFVASVEDDIATLRPERHYATADEAVAEADPLLRAWEISHALWAGRPELRFHFEHAEVVDRAPSADPPGPVGLEARIEGRSTVTGTLTTSTTRGAYPEPPAGFAVDPDVDTLFQRWVGYATGREPLLGMAYFCLSLIEFRGGGRAQAAGRYGIDQKVLRKLGELTALGGPGFARKLTPTSRRLTEKEVAWVEATAKMLIVRAGEFAAASGTPGPVVTMADLPALDS